ncbi:conserved hypothetical protein [Talaromyces stipitatus ATCC 10500]|uniref:Hsp70 family chaperone n=1 Tax=Talaromyces stipitatus (strain ATCC 10500 / CBS 375.48 / QM 6759 / NRRL 1006) TaxID=441959 RepID=B8MCI0_TALSN|nr:uncharacterized protein TSTA_125130 [Talaromyces stipitatus ATCC 10500]EED18796.1 conserved hypothetical protein [Talaromyces stipitatus ATCC 10500]
MSDKEVIAFRSRLVDLDEWHPDIVVGVDFGMTYTGVAYSCAPGWLPPRTIQRWPGKLPGELANKVPTCIEYEADSTTVKNWGFLCDQEDQSCVIYEFFKLHLAPHYRDEHSVDNSGPSRMEAQRWFRDYIQCIYQHVMNYLASTIPGFPLRKVEILFSVPTTWKDVRMIEETRTLIEQAIMTRSSNHQAAIGLTEAEAAAVYACKQHYQRGDTIMVCDAGGGTTDVNVLKLLSSTGEPTVLKQLGNVEGRPIGSVFIDRTIHQLLCERLSRICHHLPKTPTDTAWKMISGRFQRLKCSFGTDATSTPWLKLDVPSLGPGSDFPEAEIQNGQMRISWDILKRCFDVKIDEMCDLLDAQIEQTRTKYPNERISYIVLSGGFGSSPYVRKRLLDRYNSLPVKSPISEIPDQTGMHVLMADEPQLVVVHGLVLDRTQQLQQGVVIFESRCSPVSYGIICDEIYDPVRHVAEPIRLDPRDNNIYATRQIDWLVIQGKPIPHTGIAKAFQLKMELDEDNEIYKVHIVMSTLSPDNLPRSMNQGGAQRVCSLDIPTGYVDKKLKNRHWYNFKPAYLRATFDVKVVVGPADLKFQLWNKETHIRSREHEPIRVKWEPARDLNEKRNNL